MNITVAEMKANMSEILRKAANGEDIAVTKHGKPYVKIIAETPIKKKSLRGAWKGKFVFPDDLLELIDQSAINILPITPEHALAVSHLPHHHRDPFDRMLVTQAQMENLTHDHG